MRGIGTSMDGKPLLGVVYSPRSKPWWEIAEAATDLCRLLWIADKAELGPTARGLRKLGKVIDTAGCTADELVSAVRAARPDGITSYFDDDLPLQATLAAALGLTGPAVDVVARLNDKLLQRQALDSAGLPVPRFSTIKGVADRIEIDRLCETLSFPMLLKPRDGTGSRGIRSIADRNELAMALEEVAAPSQMILEELAMDTAHSDPWSDLACVETIVSGGTFSHLGIMGFFPVAPPFRLTGLFFPAALSQSDVRELLELTTASIRAVGENGAGYFRTEIKRTPDGWKIIEINGRPSGSTPTLIELASGVPVLQLCMRHALGEHVVVEGPVSSDRIAYRYIAQPPTTALRVGTISRLNELREHVGVLGIDVLKRVGDPVDWRNGGLDRVFQVTGTARDYIELAEHYRACSADSFVTYEHQQHDVPVA
jgi:biotin carboxylase